jgi:stage II sporulation protein D
MPYRFCALFLGLLISLLADSSRAIEEPSTSQSVSSELLEDPAAKVSEAQRVIRVRIFESVQAADVSGDYYEFREQDPHWPRNLSSNGINVAGSKLTDQLQTKKRTVRVHLLSDSAKSSESASWRVSFKSLKKNFSVNRLLLFGRNLEVNGKRVPERVFFWPREENRFDVIAVVSLEEYLKNVLPWEMPLSWPLEALKAQAIAARSYAVSQSQLRQNRHFDVESTVEDQVFHAKSHPDEKTFEGKLERAVEGTQGQLLLDQNNQILKAYFHADCGGATDESSEVWNATLFVSSKKLLKNGTAKDKSCPMSPWAKWEAKFTFEDLNLKLKSLLPYGEKLAQIKPMKMLNSGRTHTLLLIGSGGGLSLITSEDLRRNLGFNVLKSAKFGIAKEKLGFTFKGKGHGHGVGLCQWGSRQLARKGLGYKKILAHYYPKARLEKPNAPIEISALELSDLAKK